MKDGRTDGRQEVEVLMALVMMEAEVPGAGERPQALFTQVIFDVSLCHPAGTE